MTVIIIDNIKYESSYFPFFKISEHEDHAVFGIRYPSGKIDDILIFNQKNFMIECQKHLRFLLKEYALEEDIMLTKKALDLKKDVRNLFNLN